jgi:hypothetical protein
LWHVANALVWLLTILLVAAIGWGIATVLMKLFF